MSGDWYPAIRGFCTHWTDAPMLQETFATLEQEFADDHDASIDAAKSLVECACRVIIDELDDPLAPIKPEGADTPIHVLVGAAIRLLKLGECSSSEVRRSNSSSQQPNLLVARTSQRGWAG
jgi:hypothetical protein